MSIQRYMDWPFAIGINRLNMLVTESFNGSPHCMHIWIECHRTQ